MKKLICLFLCIAILVGTGLPTLAASSLTVNPTQSTVYVNGISTAFEAYSIDGNNYFKLRDLAYMLNGTNKRFSIGYDNTTGAITLTSGQQYVPIGGEMVLGDGKAKAAVLNKGINITKDGTPVQITAYLIGGNNFMKLRDVMRLFDVGVGYDNATQSITIDTSKRYTDGGGASTVPAPVPVPTSVDLTKNNFLQYLKIETSTENWSVRTTGSGLFTDYHYSFNLKIKISSIGNYAFENVKLTVWWDSDDYFDMRFSSRKQDLTLDYFGNAENTQAVSGTFTIGNVSPRNVKPSDIAVEIHSGKVIVSGQTNAAPESTPTPTTYPTSTLYYDEYPSVPRLENIDSSLKISSSFAFEENIIALLPQKSIYTYVYDKADSFKKADEDMLQYSKFLQSKGWELIFSKGTELVGQMFMQYTLLSPDNAFYLDIENQSTAYTLLISINTYPKSPVIMYHPNRLNPIVPDFGAFFGFPLLIDNGTIFLYSEYDDTSINMYYSLLWSFGFTRTKGASGEIEGEFIGPNNTTVNTFLSDRNFVVAILD